jgi:hypothetical protein
MVVHFASHDPTCFGVHSTPSMNAGPATVKAQGYMLWKLLSERLTMNLIIWLPAMFVLGLAVLGLMVGFVAACDRV